METLAVVKHFNGLEQARASFRPSCINVALHQHLLQGREEALGRRADAASEFANRR
jgi:hypothetical protein